jgi:hypothetical protein
VTFCPPVATFKDRRTASERNIANGLALLVECDQNAEAARGKLEWALGPATVVVESGGQYRDPERGMRPRLHLYWRLTQPTRDAGEHAALKDARRLAQAIAGSDASAVPICHPIRWPGSWHRKADPVLARIVSLGEAEITLADMRDRLAQAATMMSIPLSRGAANAATPEAPIEDIRAALAVIPNGDDVPWKKWNETGMAIWRASGASEEGREAFHEWSAKSGKYDFGMTDERWDHYAVSPPLWLGRQSLINDAVAADQRFQRPSMDAIADQSFEAQPASVVGLRAGNTYQMQRIEWLWPMAGWHAASSTSLAVLKPPANRRWPSLWLPPRP